jgi:hypothetical protein
MHTRRQHYVFVLSALLLSTTAASAVTLTPGTGTMTSGATSTGIVLSEHPELAGTTLYSSTAGYFSTFTDPNSRDSSTDAEAGTFQTTVIREAATGTLDFYYQAISTGGQYGPQYLSLGGIDPNLTLDVDYIRPPDSTPRAVAISDSGQNLYVAAPELLIRTDLTTFGQVPGSVAILFTDAIEGTQDPLSTVVPADSVFDPAPPAVPEPAGLTLLPIALAALDIRFSRKRLRFLSR